MTSTIIPRAEGSAANSRGAFDQANDAQITNARNEFSAAFQHLIPTGNLGETRVAIWKNYPEPEDSESESDDGTKDTGPWDFGPLIEGPVHLEYGTRIHVAPTAHITEHCTIVYTPMANVRIGEHVWICPGVTIISADRSGVDKNGKSLTAGRDVTIGNCSWIGFDVVIMPGVKIGHHSSVGAGSVVTEDVPPYHYVHGNPPVVKGVTDKNVTKETENVHTSEQRFEFGH